MGFPNSDPSPGEELASHSPHNLAPVELLKLDDERLAPYRQLRHNNWTHLSGIFIAEGPILVQRLLNSNYQTRSVLIDERYFDRFAPLVPKGVSMWVIPHDSVSQLLGFKFHRGVLACGSRKALLDCRAALPEQLAVNDTLAAVVGVQDPENLGGILRCCAGLGIANVLIGPNSADPLSRRVLRVSMGTALNLKLITSRDIVADLDWLRITHRVESIATSLEATAERLESAGRNGPLVVLFGNEAYGLPANVLSVVDRRLRIDMRLDTDSLNVSMAAAIVLHYFSRIAASGVAGS